MASPIRRGTGMYADSDTAANVAVQERSDTDRAQHDYEIYGYPCPAPDRNYSRHRSTAVRKRSDTDRAQHDYEIYGYPRPAPDRNYSRHRSTADLKAADYSLSDVCDLGGDEELCRLLKSQEMLNSTGETNLDTLSTGIGEARMSIPGEEEVTRLSRVAVVKAITDAYIDSRRGPMLAESTVRSPASDVQDSAGARAQHSLESSRGTLPAWDLTSPGSQSAGIGEARMSIPGEEEVTQLSQVAMLKAITDAYTDSRQGPVLAEESTVRSHASDVQDSAGARAQHSLESSRGTLPAWDLTSPGTQSAGCLEAEETTSADDVMAMLTHMATVTGMKAAYTHSCRGAAVASPFIIGGGMLFGPVGIFIGGTVGGFLGWMISEDFKSVPQVLMELSPAERQKLCAEAMAVLKNFDWTNADELIRFVTANSVVRDKVLGVLNTYITNELKAKPKYRK
ncbi:uncharacterized protein LOC135279297 isoform X3 [Passer domesticus]|uniref:uncharacterized protein LOC135279297 isoform X3 n=1 Tax=Passer domesticus TaxID=48849 RepID=UPI0030FF351E